MNNPLGRNAALQDNANRTIALNTTRSIQVAQDSYATNPVSSSASVGFTDALNDFVMSTRDAASQMREITTSTLSTLNSEFVKGISGQRTSFGDAGASIFRNVAGAGIQKAEGSILGAMGFGGGKLGTKANPMYTIAADAKDAASAAGGFLSKFFGGGSKGPGSSGLSSVLGSAADASMTDQSNGGISTIGSDLTSLIPFIPGFAGGGAVSPGTLALVGENGPELAFFGSGAHITPNHQLSSVIGSTGGDTHTWNIDARGSTDPAQTKALVQQGIMQAAPHIAAASQRKSTETNRRTPSTRR